MGEERSTARGDLALVMSGGGARAAYQVGFLRFLAKHYPQLEIQILTGVSAGAINAAFLASHSGAFHERVERLAALWCGLTVDQVFRVGPFGLFSNFIRWALRLASGGRVSSAGRGMVDTQPLRELLNRVLNVQDGVLPCVEGNLCAGGLKALAITTSSYTTGRSVTWVQGRAFELWERAHRTSRLAPITPEHVMASAALPLFFPAVKIEEAWYGDGGIRLTAPLSPAVHLGARRILAISTRYPRTEKEADGPAVDGYPPPAQVAGVLLNSIFLDLFDSDVLRLERINRLIRNVPEEERNGMRPIDLLLLRPSRDLGRLANDYEPNLPKGFRFLTRGLGTREIRSNDLLSMVMFQPDYLKCLIELGEADAELRREEIADLIRS